MRLSEMVAWIEGRGVPSLIVARSLRQVGLIRTGGRGPSAATMTAADAGALLAGIAVSSVGECTAIDAGPLLSMGGQRLVERATSAIRECLSFRHELHTGVITRLFVCSEEFTGDFSAALGLQPIRRPEPQGEPWNDSPVSAAHCQMPPQAAGAITVPEFCRRAGISTRAFYLLANKGEAPETVRIGRARRILESTANDWLKAREA